MFNFDYITTKYIKEHDPKQQRVPNDPYRILTVGRFGSGKTNALLNLTIIAFHSKLNIK